jgi:hypothetical protein
VNENVCEGIIWTQTLPPDFGRYRGETRLIGGELEKKVLAAIKQKDAAARAAAIGQQKEQEQRDEYLRANAYRTYVVRGGGRDFVRA